MYNSNEIWSKEDGKDVGNDPDESVDVIRSGIGDHKSCYPNIFNGIG